MSQTASPENLTARYGAPKKGPSARTQRWLIIGALVLSFAAALYFTIGNAVGQLSYKDVGYTIHSDTSASVDYEVGKDFDATVQCSIQVLDDSYAIVGHQIVTIGPHEGTTASDREQYYRTELRTEARGVSGIVESCWEHEA